MLFRINIQITKICQGEALLFFITPKISTPYTPTSHPETSTKWGPFVHMVFKFYKTELWVDL